MKLSDLDLNKLSTFLVVVEAGGVSSAARRLGRTSSAVSQAIAALEAALECPLFDRLGKRLVLTRNGQELCRRLEAYQRGLLEALEAARGSADQVRGVVRVGLFLGFPRARLCQLMAEFGRRFPAASLCIVYAPERDLERRLLKNQLDCVLSFRSREHSAALTSTELFTQQLVLVSGRRYFERGFNPRELSEVPVVDYYRSDPLIQRWLAHHYPHDSYAPRVRFWAATTDLVLDLIVSDAGVGVLPRHLVAPLLVRRRLEELGPRRRPLVDRVWLNEPRHASRDATLEAFRALALELSSVAPARPQPLRPGAIQPTKRAGSTTPRARR